MKKVVIFCLIICTLFSIAGCKTMNNPSEDSNDLNSAWYITEPPKFPEIDSYEFVNVRDYTDCEIIISKFEDEISEDFLNDMIMNYLYSHLNCKRQKAVPVTVDSLVEIEFTAYYNNEVVSSMTSHGIIPVWLRYSEMPQALLDEILTMNTGNTRTVEVVFPDDYHNTEVRNKRIVFEVTLHYVIDKPEMTDANVEMASDGSITTLNALKDYLRASFKESQQQAQTSVVQNKIQVLILDKTDVEIPDDIKEWYINWEIYHVVNTSGAKTVEELDAYIQHYVGVTLAEYREMMKTELRTITALTYDLALRRIAELENIEITDDEYESNIQQFANDLGYDSITDAEKTMSKNGIRDAMLLDKVYDWLLDHNTIIDENL